MTDIAININSTSNGDIALSPPLTDDNGVALLSPYSQDGVLKPLRDIALVNNDLEVKQSIFARLKTQNPDWYHNPYIGADLEDLIGEPNTKATANVGVSGIARSLQGIGIFDVRAVPVDDNRIAFIVKTLDPKATTIVSFDYDIGIEEII